MGRVRLPTLAPMRVSPVLSRVKSSPPTENKGDFNGNGTVDYVMIMGDPENVDAPYRTEYSIKALNDAGITTNKLFEQRGDWLQENGQQLAATALAQFGQDVDVIFCNNDAMALGRLSGDRGCRPRGK